MPENTLTIALKYNRKDLESIYFADDQGNLARMPGVSQLAWVIIIAVAAAPLSMWKAQEGQEPIWVWCAVMAFLVATMAIIMLMGKGWAMFKWKRSVTHFIDGLDGTTETIACTSASICFTTAHQTIITKWEAVQQVGIRDGYISLIAGSDWHFLPAASMRPEEYSTLTEFLKSKMSGQEMPINTKWHNRL